MNDDTISRQAAINSPVKMIAQGLDWVPVYHLEQLPSAERLKMQSSECEYWDDESNFCTLNRPSAERRGRWIENEFGAYCSKCGLYAYRSNGIPWKSNYCPNCGARMEVE